MRSRVVWLRSALAEATRAYIRLRETSGDAETITRAMAAIDTLLESDPSHQGESRLPGERVFTEPPLTVRFEIHEEEEVVVIWRVVYRTPTES